MTRLFVLLGVVGWLTFVVRQLRLSRTEGRVLSRNGYAFRARNPRMFDLGVVTYWVYLVAGIGVLIAILIPAIIQISN